MKCAQIIIVIENSVMLLVILDTLVPIFVLSLELKHHDEIICHGGGRGLGKNHKDENTKRTNTSLTKLIILGTQ